MFVDVKRQLILLLVAYQAQVFPATLDHLLITISVAEQDLSCSKHYQQYTISTLMTGWGQHAVETGKWLYSSLFVTSGQLLEVDLGQS